MSPALGKVAVLSVPTEAGTHFPGQYKAPAAVLNTDGLEPKLKSAGYNVTVHDVLTDEAVRKAAQWVPATKKNGVRSEDNTLTIMKAVQSYLRDNRDTLQ